MTHFIATTEKMSVERLVRLFWKLLENIISDRGPQFAVEVIKELNKILEIKTKLSMVYYPQIDGQMEKINQELEQYLYMFINHRQEQWPEWLSIVEFAYNNKIHLATKVLPFRANCRQDPRMEFKRRRKGKYKAAGKFVNKNKNSGKSKGNIEKGTKEDKTVCR